MEKYTIVLPYECDIITTP